MKKLILSTLIVVFLTPAISSAYEPIDTTSIDVEQYESQEALEQLRIQLMKRIIALLQLRIQELIALRDGTTFTPTVLGIATSTDQTVEEEPRRRRGGGGGGGSSRSSSNDTEVVATTTEDGTDTATTTATSSIANLHDFQFTNGEDTTFTPEVENGWLATAHVNFDADATVLNLVMQLREESDESSIYEIFTEFGLWLDGDKIATTTIDTTSGTISFTGLDVTLFEDEDTELVIGVDISDSDSLLTTQNFSLFVREIQYQDANSTVTTETELGDIGEDGAITFSVLPVSIYATVTSLSDSKGNSYTQSQHNGQDSTWPSPRPELVVGETITITVDVQNTTAEPVLYQFNGTGFPNVWQEDNSVTVTIDDETFNVETIHLRVFIKNSDTLYRSPDYDDMIQVFYTKSSSTPTTTEPYDATLEFKSSPDNPDATTLVVDKDDKTDFTILVFEVEAEEGPVMIDEAYVLIETPEQTTSGIIDDSKLIINGQVYNQDGMTDIDGDDTAQLHMFSINTVLQPDEPLEIAFSVEFEGYEGAYTVPQDIQASIDLDTRSLWETTGYDDLNPATDYVGTVVGEAHTLFGAGLYLDNPDTSTELIEFDAGGSIGIFEIEFEATAIEEDFYFTDTATTSNLGEGLQFYIEGPSGVAAVSAVLTSTADELSNGVYEIQEGETQVITLQVEIEASESGNFRIGLQDLFVTENFNGVTNTQSTVIQDPFDYRTDYLVIIAD